MFRYLRWVPAIPFSDTLVFFSAPTPAARTVSHLSNPEIWILYQCHHNRLVSRRRQSTTFFLLALLSWLQEGCDVADRIGFATFTGAFIGLEVPSWGILGPSHSPAGIEEHQQNTVPVVLLAIQTVGFERCFAYRYNHHH